MNRGLKATRNERAVHRNGGHIERPDEQGTESAAATQYMAIVTTVTLRDPMNRGLKAGSPLWRV